MLTITKSRVIFSILLFHFFVFFEKLYQNKKDPYEWYNVVNNKKYRKKLKMLRNQLNQILK